MSDSRTTTNSSAVFNPDQRIRALHRSITVDYSPSVKLPAYFRVCRSMLVMARQHESDGLLPQAYCLERRLIFLFIDYISKRQDFKDLDQNQRKFWADECKSSLERAEKLRARIYAIFQADEKAYLEQLASEAAANNKKTAASPVATNGVPSSRASPPSVNQTLTPATLTPASNDLKPIYVPRSLGSTFINIAASNTQKNIETCATLCGRMINGSEFIVSHLVLLKQLGTCDSCVTTNEEDLVVYMDAKNLIALGWIHTHPTQTVFMSSIDLHCQLSYQIMLPEAISIVCSPRLNETKYFSLTPEYGINFLKGCRQSGFHSHNVTQDLYNTSPHVVHTDGAMEVVDLRTV